MSAPSSIIKALADRDLLGAAFVGPSWDTWRAILKAAYGLRMTSREIELFRAVADRDPPERQVRELIVIAGRRGGKDSVASAIAAYAAAFRDYRPLLRPGEQAVCACLASDREQAKIVLGYTKAFFAKGPLAGLVTRETADGVELSTGATIEIVTNSLRSARGRTIALAIFDEVAFWRDDNSANPDKETYRAIVPSLATVPGSMLIMISSPYRKSGLLYEKYKRHYGQPGDVLVIRAPTLALNPTIDQSIIDAAMADDPAAAAAEWLAEFRNDISGFIDRDTVNALVTPGCHELPPMPGINYVAFVDPSGGVSDSMTLAIAHRDKWTDHDTLDLIREWRPPFSPDSVVQEIAGILQRYSITSVRGDRYAGEWPRERFQVHGVTYEPSDKTKSEIYLNILPALNSGQVDLLDNPRLISQLCGLERRTARGGRDSIDHEQGGKDDSANSACGALLLAGNPGTKIWFGAGAPAGFRGRPAPQRFFFPGEPR